jgi:hypothetical protein
VGLNLHLQKKEIIYSSHHDSDDVKDGEFLGGFPRNANLISASMAINVANNFQSW